MKVQRLRGAILLMGMVASPFALAQDGGYRDGAGADLRSYGGYGGDPVVDGDAQGRYDYARVLRVDPIIVSGGSERCYDRYDGGEVYDGRGRSDGVLRRQDGYDEDYRRGGTDGGRQLATVIGGVAGAVLGSQIGGGDGRYLGSALGGLLGGTVGRSIYEARTREPVYRDGNVRVCEPTGYVGNGNEAERVDGYTVTYEYGGRTYQTRRDYHPGERIRVRVDVSAD